MTRKRFVIRPPDFSPDVVEGEEAWRRAMRSYSVAELQRDIDGDDKLPAWKTMAAAELRRREAWSTPAAWSLGVSVLALVTAIVALCFNIFRL